MNFFTTRTKTIVNRTVLFIYFNEKDHNNQRPEAGYIFKTATGEWLAISSTKKTSCNPATKKEGIQFIEDQF